MAVYLRVIKGGKVPAKVLLSPPEDETRRGLAAILENAEEIRL